MTAQVMDKFLYEGKEMTIADVPLGHYLKDEQITKFHPPHSAFWRGYVATWELRGQSLFFDRYSGFRRK